MEPIRYFKKGKQILKIYRDEHPVSPREWDNLGTIATWHRRYQLGDEQPKRSPEEYIGDLAKEYIKDPSKKAIILNVYMYDHGGITLSTKPFSDPWDSGQVGIIYATPEKIAQEDWSADKPEDVEKIKNCLRGEIKTYSQYLEGDVYGFVLGHHEVCEKCGNTEFVEEDSCWGFYGYDIEENGILDQVGITDIEDWEEIG